MNILMITSKNDKYGAQRIFLDQVSALRRLGHQVVVVGRGDEGFIADSVRSMNVDYYGIPMKGIRDILFLMRLVKKYTMDVIHSSLDRADYFGVLLSRLARRPLVSTMNVRRYHIGYRFADRVVTVSNKQKELLLSNGIKAERISVIRPWIDAERYANPVAESGCLETETQDRRIQHRLLSYLEHHPAKEPRISLELIAECKRRGKRLSLL
jgi:glycosyltransferase involved in cell wall biosynthesis